MKPKMIHKNSMASKILLTCMVLVLLEGAVFLVMLFGSNIQKELNDNAHQAFYDKVAARKNTLENILTSNVYKSELYDDILQQSLNLYTINKEMSVTPQLANSLKALLNNTLASGAFIIFDSDTTIHQGFSIKDMEPSNVSINDGDLAAQFGNGDVIKEIGLTMSHQWKSTIALDQTSPACDFYYQPFTSVKNYPTYSPLDLAYWSKPYQILGNAEELVSFSFPLIDEQQQAYGVLGLQFSLDYLKTLLPYNELNNEKGAYILSYHMAGETSLTPLLVSGPHYHDIQTPYQIVPSQKKEDFYTLQDSAFDKTDIVVQHLTLYNHNSPFIEESWSLAGFVPESVLLSGLHKLAISLLIAVLATVIIGIIATFMFTLNFSKPFRILLQTLHNADPNKPLVLPKVNILELDQLGDVVENMSNHIMDSSSRLLKITQMMNLPLGAIEIDKTSDHVFYTGKIAELLNFSEELKTKNTIPLTVFQQEINRFNTTIVKVSVNENDQDDLSKIYLVETCDIKGHSIWLQCNVLIKDDTVLMTINDITKETLEKQKLEYERDYDSLTDLLNRRAFHEEFDDIIKHKDLRSSALLLWDLDNLKFINDTYGHDFGDLYIKEASNIFLSLDPEHAIAARMAGDEFLVFLYGMESRERLLALAENIHHSMTMQEIDLLDNDKIRIRSSAGIAWYPEDGREYEKLLKHADYAMYSAKHNLKGSMEVFDYQKYKNEYVLFETVEDFNHIIDEKRYRFAFQPIVDAHTGDIFGYEALIRPEGKIIKTPPDLIRLARSQSKLQIIERISFLGALAEYHNQRAAFKDTHLFVNSIPKITWGEKVVSSIEETYKDDLHRLVIEIIESDQLTSDNLQLKQNTIKRWHAALALDDFGSGYNNDTAILAIHPQYLKIDQELIRDIVEDERRQMIVHNLIQYAKAQHIKIIGEGVETHAQLKFLIEAGIDYLQGYYIAKPTFKVSDLSDELRQEIITLAKKK